MESWGKVAVMARDVPGFIVNRVARPFYGEGWRALEEGAASPATLDFLYRDLAGFRMGPFELGDFIGHDINTTAAKSIFDAYYGRTRFTPSLMQAQLAASGRLGRKSGRGVYDYGDGAAPPEPEFCNDHVKANADIKVGLEATAIEALLDACNVSYARSAAVPHGFAEVDNALITYSYGETASALHEAYGRPIVVLDWIREPKKASAMAFSMCCEPANRLGIEFARLCGKKAVILKDRPGLVVFRTLLQLVNSAGDAIRDGVADHESIDRALINGVGYPFGPMMWARDYGYSRVVAALEAIARETGEALYRPSEILRAYARRMHGGW
jgi:3-hydroxybutyryl-CoA dehydrogenase